MLWENDENRIQMKRTLLHMYAIFMVLFILVMVFSLTNVFVGSEELFYGGITSSICLVISMMVLRNSIHELEDDILELEIKLL